jgi:hypothetical protein
MPGEEESPTGEAGNLFVGWENVLLAELGVFFAETVNTAGGVHKALLAGVERVAAGADFHVYHFTLGGGGVDFVAAGAYEFGLVHGGMDIVFHENSP